MAEFMDIVIDQESDELDFWFEDDHGQPLTARAGVFPLMVATESEIRIRIQHDTIEKL
jgi:hypothetical protein